MKSLLDCLFVGVGISGVLNATDMGAFVGAIVRFEVCDVDMGTILLTGTDSLGILSERFEG